MSKLDLYTWNTPNGRKTTIMLEEIAQPYTLIKVDIGIGAQKQPNFLHINPNGRIPALFDHQSGARVFESGAILVYLAEKFPAGKKLLPSAPAERAEVLSWTYWQTGGLGPILGQYNHFSTKNINVNYAKQRFKEESIRLLNILDDRLKESPFLGGKHYSIADIMCFPWVSGALKTLAPSTQEAFKNFNSLLSWHQIISARPAVKKGLMRLDDVSNSRY
ncbi:glutathione S-transferase family protein [Saccharophagus degradans]|uniref:Glutathione S-transferase-like protein n=1 Tax=Saccharophagus degradans (strain 2-40 / ATCC 43961 / DSM 17024) TaxID=203122 RepID=Q21F44_SACD2|nr:glutathione S-transferase N-terminal domain-containing protein [Saccharophagus degradans]ABD82685.1 glutathione S-transferase-like protein [Saccharophagus degradans 2-40]